MPVPPQKPDVAEHGAAGLRTEQMEGDPSGLTCPQCGGALWERYVGQHSYYECHTGHGFTEASLAREEDQKVEEAMWTALRALEESAHLRRRMAERARGRTDAVRSERFDRDAAEYESRADLLREVILKVPPASRMPGDANNVSSSAGDSGDDH